jgi:light-regulated signal transduction histidine kinase (bacteriophytochrome)
VSEPYQTLHEGLDLSVCDREPIHIPGSIQPHGFLLGCSLPDWKIVQASANTAEFLAGLAPEALLGHDLEHVLPIETVHSLRNLLQTTMLSGSAERLNHLAMDNADTRFDMSVHVSGGLAIIEGTPSLPHMTADPITLVKGLIGRLKRAPSLDRFLKQAAQQIRAFTGYDRVMIYKFLHDNSGQVIAEALRPGMDPFLGLHYPASDIPAQARALYKRQWLRVITDTNYRSVPLMPGFGPDGLPLDLSLSTLRSVSPVHIEYLHNMNVQATMTVSIMRGDELWGLIACHHSEPYCLSGTICAAAELFGQVLSLQVEAREQQEEMRLVSSAHEAHDRLIASMSPHETLFDNLADFAANLNDVIPCDGIGVWSDSRFTGYGITPPVEAIEPLIRFFGLISSNAVYTTQELGKVFPPARAYAHSVSGVLAIPFSRSPRDYLLFFRREMVQTISWGGNPNKPVITGERISPRKSFETWKETVKEQSLPWRSGEKQIAETLRISLLEVILRRAELIAQERQIAQESQSLLIAELNHRVKNILSLIRAVVRQSSQQTTSVKDFTADLEHRINALAKAHDQMNQVGWASAPLLHLLEAEAQAWASGEQDRVMFSGPAIILDARAYQTLALVFHEMMTNAVKYGALSRPTGHLLVSWHLVANQDLRIEWCESGGPIVAAPSRRGFGSVVIERTIPFELQGEARIEYRIEGVQGSFLIPAQHVSVGNVAELRTVPSVLTAQSLEQKKLLLVEDSMMIALDAQAMLQEAGADVEIAGTVNEARRALSFTHFDVVVLDVNLSGETSLSIAEELALAQHPFIFATGYGENTVIPDRFKDVPLISKPYSAGSLTHAINRFGIKEI